MDGAEDNGKRRANPVSLGCPPRGLSARRGKGLNERSEAVGVFSLSSFFSFINLWQKKNDDVPANIIYKKNEKPMRIKNKSIIRPANRRRRGAQEVRRSEIERGIAAVAAGA